MRCPISGLLLAALALAGCKSAPDRWPDSGVYELVSVVEGPGALPPAGAGERWFPYAPAAVDEGPARHVLLRANGAVPLELARDPVCRENEEGKKQIALTLTDEAGSALADLTRRLVGGRVAVVIAGEAVSYHKVRQPILGNGVLVSS